MITSLRQKHIDSLGVLDLGSKSLHKTKL